MRLLVFSLLLVVPLLSWDVLITNVLASGSHQPITKYVANLLASNGHTVTYLSTNIPKHLHPAVVKLPMPTVEREGYSIMTHSANRGSKAKAEMSWGQVFSELDTLFSGCETFYGEPNVKALMQTKKKYDLFITFIAFFDPCALSLAHHLKIDNVIIHSPSNAMFPNHIVLLGLPLYASSQKLHGIVLTEPGDLRTSMTARLTQLLKTGAGRFLHTLAVRYYIDPVIYANVPDYPGHVAAYDKVKMLFMNVHFHPMIDYPYSLGPGVVNLGGRMCAEYKPDQISEDLTAFIESKDTFIFVSFGSILKKLDPHEESLLIETFSKLPFNVVWKISELNSDVAHLPDNVKLVSWAPQMSLLQHPHIKLFVTHGGHASKTESFCAGLPFLIVPRFALDQYMNAERYKAMGISDNILSLNDSTAEEIHTKIMNMLDERYVAQYKVLQRQLLATRVTEEQVLGYIDMAISGHKLLPGYQPFWEYFYLDIIVIPVAVIAGIRYFINKIRRYF